MCVGFKFIHLRWIVQFSVSVLYNTSWWNSSKSFSLPVVDWTLKNQISIIVSMFSFLASDRFCHQQQLWSRWRQLQWWRQHWGHHCGIGRFAGRPQLRRTVHVTVSVQTCREGWVAMETSSCLLRMGQAARRARAWAQEERTHGGRVHLRWAGTEAERQELQVPLSKLWGTLCNFVSLLNV